MAKHSTKLPTRKTENRSFARRGLVAEEQSRRHLKSPTAPRPREASSELVRPARTSSESESVANLLARR